MFHMTHSALQSGRWRLAASLALVLTHGANAGARDIADYQCAVLGDAKACRPAMPAPASEFEDSLEPGPAALYLMHLGTDKVTALKLARAHGELPTGRVVRRTRSSLSGEALYRRASGTDGSAEALQP